MEKLFHFLQKKFGDYSNLKILDIGTGRGDFIGFLLESLGEDIQITGIDTSDAMLESAKKQFTGKNVKFLNRDGADTGFMDNEFDIVILSNSLHHLENISPVINEMIRVSNKYLIFNEMFKDNQSKEQISHVKLHHFNAKLDQMSDRVHNFTYDKGEIISLVSNYELDITDELEYMTADEQSSELKKPEDRKKQREEEKEFLENIQAGLSKRIEMIKDENVKKQLSGELDDMVEYIDENGIFSCTELLLVAQKK